MTRHSASEVPLHSDAPVLWHRILMVLLGLGLILMATQVFAAPATWSDPKPAPEKTGSKR